MTAAQLAHLAELSAYAADYVIIPTRRPLMYSAMLHCAPTPCRLVCREEQQARESAGLAVTARTADGVTL